MVPIADRVVEVLLRLKTDQYKREAGEAADKTERLKRGIDDVDDELKKLPADAAKAAAAMKLLGTEAIGTGNYIKGVGDKGTALKVLNVKIRETEEEVRRLGEQFVRTGSVDVWQHLNKADSQLRALNDMRRRLADALEAGTRDGAKAAADVWRGSVMETFSALPSEVKLALVASLVGVALAAAPLIGSAITSGILLGVGGVGLGAGIALAAKDPVIAAAYAQLGDQIAARLKTSVMPFRSELVTSAAIFGSAFDRNAPKLDHIFATLAVRIRPLADGLSRLVDNALPGIDRAVVAAGPILQALADNLPQMGKALDMFFTSIANGGPGAAAGFKFILVSVEALIVALGWLFEALSKVFGLFDKIARGVRGLFTGDNGNLTHQLAAVGDSAEQAGTGAESFGRKLNFTKNALSDMTSEVKLANAAFDQLFGTMMNVDTANLHVKKGMADLARTAREGGATHDEITGKVLRQIQALEDQRKAQLATGDGSAAATARINAAYQAQLEQLKRMFPWLDALISKYEALAQDRTAHIDIIIKEKRIGSVSNEGVVSGGDPRRNTGKGLSQGGIRHAADGFVVPPSYPGAILMGEPQTGGEVLIPRQGITQQRALELLQTAGAGYGLGVAPSRWRAGGSSGPSTVVVQATFVDPVDGTVTRRQIVTAAANRGQSVAQFLGV